MSSRFKTVGYLVPSGTGKTFKVYVEGKFCGLIYREEVASALRYKPSPKIKISKFVEQSEAKP